VQIIILVSPPEWLAGWVVLCGHGGCSVLAKWVDTGRCCSYNNTILTCWGGAERWTLLWHREGTTCCSVSRSRTTQWYKDQLIQDITREQARRDVSLEMYILPLSHIYLYSHCSSFHSVSYFLLYTLIIQLKYKNIVKHFIFQLFFPHTSHQYSKNVKYVCCLKVVKITRVKMYIKYFTIWHIHLLYLHMEFISLSVYITILYHILLRIYTVK